MAPTIGGIVKGGVIVPDELLPENAHVEIHVLGAVGEQPGRSVPPTQLSPAELRQMPRAQRQTVLAAAAELAEEDYRTNPELTGFDAFAEEGLAVCVGMP